MAVDQFFDLDVLAQDVAKRKFMAVGFAAWLLLLPLAVTSTDALGAPARLRALEAAAPAGLRRRRCSACVHFVWRVKADALRPYVYAAVIGLLLLARVVSPARRLARGAAAAAVDTPPSAALNAGRAERATPWPRNKNRADPPAQCTGAPPLRAWRSRSAAW